MATADSSAARHLDAVAVKAALRRLARAPHAPWLHAEVARRMAQRLEIIRLQPATVIDWWGWLGAGEAELERVYPKAARIVVEPDRTWVERSRAAARRPWWTAGHWSRPATQVLAEDADLPTGAQLVWANMMLHAVNDPPALFDRWQRLLSVDGFVMFSCLGPGTLRELRAVYERRGWGGATPGFIDMHDLGDMLLHAGFTDPVMDQETLTLHWASPEALLAEVHSLGGNAAPDRCRGLRTARWRRALLRELETLADAGGRIAMSFEVAYGHAFKAPPRPAAGGPTTVSLEDMRSMVRSSRGRGPAGPVG